MCFFQVNLLYYYYEEMSVAEIAAQLAVQETTVRNRLALARDKIRKTLKSLEKDEGLKLYMSAPLILVPLLHLSMRNTQITANLLGSIISSLSNQGIDNERLVEPIAEGTIPQNVKILQLQMNTVTNICAK
ncbi:MAG: hypothetical protein FWH20_04145 [Oscillospiraceae bacterium]|nr:hypothetical protein [Oscillospiraceae bacterium]